ncbi:MAG: hypothetical protein KCHDKBKB_02988 [Elusimicrobia bacterium]|nr:hypothetical protein [Elusimicrobiota bacterium]
MNPYVIGAGALGAIAAIKFYTKDEQAKNVQKLSTETGGAQTRTSVSTADTKVQIELASGNRLQSKTIGISKDFSEQYKVVELALKKMRTDVPITLPGVRVTTNGALLSAIASTAGIPNAKFQKLLVNNKTQLPRIAKADTPCIWESVLPPETDINIAGVDRRWYRAKDWDTFDITAQKAYLAWACMDYVAAENLIERGCRQSNEPFQTPDNIDRLSILKAYWDMWNKNGNDRGYRPLYGAYMMRKTGFDDAGNGGWKFSGLQENNAAVVWRTLNVMREKGWKTIDDMYGDYLDGPSKSESDVIAARQDYFGGFGAINVGTTFWEDIGAIMASALQFIDKAISAVLNKIQELTIVLKDAGELVGKIAGGALGNPLALITP